MQLRCSTTAQISALFAELKLCLRWSANCEVICPSFTRQFFALYSYWLQIYYIPILGSIDVSDHLLGHCQRMTCQVEWNFRSFWRVCRSQLLPSGLKWRRVEAEEESSNAWLSKSISQCLESARSLSAVAKLLYWKVPDKYQALNLIVEEFGTNKMHWKLQSFVKVPRNQHINGTFVHIRTWVWE